MSESFDRRSFLRIGGIALAAGATGCSLATSDDETTSGQQSTSTRATSRRPAPTRQRTQSPAGQGTGPSAGETSGRTATASESGPRETAETDSGRQTDASVYTEVYRDTISSVVLIDAGSGRGTGFVFDGSHVVTNAHVVGGADAVSVRFEGGQWTDGRVAGTDPHADLAAVAVESLPSGATPLPFVQSEPAVGQEVVAIGNPYSLNGSLTTGVVSGTDRLIPGPTGYRIPDAVQTDAAVNPGNSGGPLMSLDGRVAAVINSGGGDNIAFGISAALTERVVPELIATGDYDHAYAGASVTDVTPSIAAANDLGETRGLIVVDVAAAGPARDVLEPSQTRLTESGRVPVGGDVLLAIDGRDLLTTEDLWSYLALEARPGDTVDLDIVREGTRRTVSLELDVRPQ